MVGFLFIFIMDLIEDIIANWFNSKGYFLIRNLKIGVNEVDILAIKLSNRHQIEDSIHIEVQCSTKPIGYIGGSKSAKKRTSEDVDNGVTDYINKKFNNKKIKDVIEQLIGSKYRKIFICGKLKDEDTLKYFIKNGVEVMRVWEILEKIKFKEEKYKTSAGNRYYQLLYINGINKINK